METQQHLTEDGEVREGAAQALPEVVEPQATPSGVTQEKTELLQHDPEVQR